MASAEIQSRLKSVKRELLGTKVNQRKVRRLPHDAALPGHLSGPGP